MILCIHLELESLCIAFQSIGAGDVKGMTWRCQRGGRLSAKIPGATRQRAKVKKKCVACRIARHLCRTGGIQIRGPARPCQSHSPEKRQIHL